SGTTGGAWSTVSLWSGVGLSRLFNPMRNGATTMPWKSKRQSVSSAGGMPKEGVVPPGSAPTCGAEGSKLSDGSRTSEPRLSSSCADADNGRQVPSAVKRNAVSFEPLVIRNLLSPYFKFASRGAMTHHHMLKLSANI